MKSFLTRGLVAVISVSLLAPSSLVVASDWVRFHYGPENAGHAQGETLALPFSSKWTYQADNPITFSSPVIAGGKLFVGDDGGKLYAINTSDGSLSWSFTASSSIYVTPQVVSSTVYFGDLSGRFYALSTTNGTQTWQYATTSAVAVSPMATSSASLTNVVYGLADGTLVALNRTDGTYVWSVKPGGTFGYHSLGANTAFNRIFAAAQNGDIYSVVQSSGALSCTYTASNDTFDRSSPQTVAGATTILVGSEGGTLYLINSSNCTLRNSFAADGDFVGTPAFRTTSPFEIFAATVAGSLYRIDYNSSTFALTESWKVDLGSAINSSPAFATMNAPVSGFMILLGTDALNVYSRADGDLLDTIDTGGAFEQSSVAVSGDEIFVANATGKISALKESQTQGAFVSNWKRNLSSRIVSTAVVPGGADAYFGTRDGKYHSVKTDGTATNWSFVADTAPASRVADVDATNGVLYFGTDSGKFYGVNTSNGTEKWSRGGIGQVTSQPVVIPASNVVYVPTVGGILYDLNATTGATNQSYSTSASGLNLSSVATTSTKVYFSYGNKAVVALNRSDFTTSWTYTMGGSNTTEEPTYIDISTSSPPTVFAGGVDGVYAINDSGSQVWKTGSGIFVATTFDKTYNRVYGSTRDGRVVAFNASTGTQLWSTSVSSSPVSRAIVYKDIILVYSQGKVTSLSSQHGLVRTTQAEVMPPLSPPRVSTSTIVIGSRTGLAKEYKLEQYTAVVDSTLGGTITSIFNDQLIVPANALGADTSITMALTDNDLTPSAGTAALPRKYKFTPNGTNFSPAATFKIAYKDYDLAGEPEADIRMFLFRSSSNTYEEQTGTLDTTNKLFSISISSFSTYIPVVGGIPKELKVPILNKQYAHNAEVVLRYGARMPGALASVSASLNGEVVSSGEKITLSKLGENIVKFVGTKADGSVVSNTQTFEVMEGEPTVLPDGKLQTKIALWRTLAHGVESEEVRVLQEYLARDPAVYPEGLVTGYFGDYTKEAVKRFQAKYNIVREGDEGTTGYGLVGPRTRETILKVFP